MPKGNTEETKQDQCRKAIPMVLEEGFSFRKACSECNISARYVTRRFKGEVAMDARCGVPTIFTKDEEKTIAHCLKDMAKRGWTLQAKDLLDFIKIVMDRDKRKSPFKNNRPSYRWYKSFKVRNQHIVELPRNAPTERRKLTREEVDRWCTDYNHFIESLNLQQQPNRIWSADETSFLMRSRSDRVVGPVMSGESDSSVTAITPQHLTVVLATSAAGVLMPPLHVYPSPPPFDDSPLTGAIHGTVLHYSQDGQMTHELFRKFLEHFNTHCGSDRPVVLLIDNLSRQISLDTFQYASQHGIELYRIAPNRKGQMQPLHTSISGKLKNGWKGAVKKFSQSCPGEGVGKANFVMVLKDALKCYKPFEVIDSFEATGLFPVDSTKITDIMLS